MIVIALYNEISTGDAERVMAQLRAAPSDQVEVRINSPGGSVTEGLALFNMLKPRKPTVFIDGIAASIASLIAMAGATIIAAENALIMIHDPWVVAEGNSNNLRRTADALDKHRDAMLRGYARSGLSDQRLTELLCAETWLSADEALALGFIDEVTEPLPYAAHASACYANFRNTPLEITEMPNASHAARAANPAAPSTPNAPTAPNAPAQPNTAPTEDQIANAIRVGLSADPVTQSATDSIMQALRDRNNDMLAMVQPYLHRDAVRNYVMGAIADPTLRLEDYRAQVMSLLGRECTPISGGGGRIDGGDGRGDFVAAASDALAIRAGIKVAKPHPGARDIQGMALSDVMRACVNRSGRIMDMGSQSKNAVVRAAMSTSDFPAILENTLGKTLRAGFEEEPATIDSWCSKVMVPDFKPQSRVILGSAPDLDLIPEGAEYKSGSMDEDRSVPYVVNKFGKIVTFTWEAMVNDDLGAFLKMTQAMGQAAARAEADAVYATFAENSGAGPKMQDTNNLFGSAHSNLATSAADITADALSAARVLLRRQKAVGGGVMNITPRFLLVAPEQEQAGETLLAAAARSLSQGSDTTLVPAWLAQLQLVVEARLDGSAFYLLAAPTSVDTLERAWLDADNGPVVVEQDSFGIDAKQYKVRHVFGQRWLDWRGAVKVPLS